MNRLSAFTVSLLALSGLGSAGPLAPRAIADRDYFNIRLYGEYAAAAYCLGNRDRVLNPISLLVCPVARNCPQVEDARSAAVLKFGTPQSPVYDTSGYVAVDPRNRLIVVAFQGTDLTRTHNVVGNLNSFGQQSPVAYCTGCNASRGYLEAFQEVQTIVVDAVLEARRVNSGFQVVTTGHSLGGAVATIAALELRSRGIPVHAASYGAPRTLNPALADFATRQDNPNNSGVGDRNYRVIHKDDFTPDANPLSTNVDVDGNPTLFTVLTRHTSPAYNITAGNGPQTPTADDINIVVGGDRDTGASDNFATSLPAHSFYFNRISACD